MKKAAFILRDQLSLDFSFIKDATFVVMVEDVSWAIKLPHHKKKIVLHFSAMRHFADELIKLGKDVLYYPMCFDLHQVFLDLKNKDKITTLTIMEPSEYGVLEHFKKLATKAGIEVDLCSNEQFIYGDEVFDFKKKPPLLETFYRFMRKKTGVLMQGAKPVSGVWNFDEENRQKAPKDLKAPAYLTFEPDEITKQVIKEVQTHFPKNFGSLENFNLACTRKEALRALKDFIKHRLDLFGPYQDAMVVGEPVLYHSLLSPYLNINLLRPMEVILAAENAFIEKQARLASVEGFIRQILGWREFVYQVYKAGMPSYIESNHFKHKRSLPHFYWDAKTDMRCIKEAVTPVIEEGINHHIQRLMVTGNFALIAQISPQEVNDWYHLAYIDALEWVVTPNVLGLSLYADGGKIATKPYASSAGYIQKMSNYCSNCPYNAKTFFEKDSCPFNALFWNFIHSHEKEFLQNQRMSLMVNVWKKKAEHDKISILKRVKDLDIEHL
jgi:deoxyribodipyrimidine photolyase-related protein